MWSPSACASSLKGRTAVVTGANSGIGLETARVLAREGVVVVMACRSLERGAAAAASLLRESPEARVQVRELDLASLASVEAFARGMEGEEGVSLLVNNAGVMFPPPSPQGGHARSAEGTELQFATNHVGHFALTARLWPLLVRAGRARGAPASRVVTVASLAAHYGALDLADPSFERRSYWSTAAYGQSKLANLAFMLELQRRIAAAGLGDAVMSLAAHPGWTQTELMRHSLVIRLAGRLVAMRPMGGALPSLRAATDPDAFGGQYYGPGNFTGVFGPPAPGAAIPRGALVADDASALWALTERLAGVQFLSGGDGGGKG